MVEISPLHIGFSSKKFKSLALRVEKYKQKFLPVEMTMGSALENLKRRYILAAKFHILRKITQTRPKAQNNLKISYLDFEEISSHESASKLAPP